MTDPDAYGE